MNHEEAVERLRAAGLRTHDLGVEHGIMGGSFVDRSSGMGMVQNCYLLKPNPDGNYETFIEPLDPQRRNLPYLRTCSNCLSSSRSLNLKLCEPLLYEDTFTVSLRLVR